MLKLRYLASLVLLALLVSLFLFWLAANQISFVFSVAAYGYPDNLGYLVLNVIFLCLFVVFIKLRRKVARLPASIYLAFIVALFIEMYGFHLTMFVILWALGYSTPGNLWYLLARFIGEDSFVSVFYGVLLPVSNVLILGGIFLVVFGWRRIFREKDQLVTTGIYGHVRHPQYLGFLLITLGINVLWVTISTLLLWPILTVLYFRLAKEEEKGMLERFGEEYREYKDKVPMFIPRLRTRKQATQQDVKN